MGTGETVAVASAPGKCILFGEHAVVYGQPAVAVALKQRLTVSMKPASSWSVDGSPLRPERHPHICMLKDRLLAGSDVSPMALHIQADIPRASGLGSSAALSAAVSAALTHLLEPVHELKTQQLSENAHLAEAHAQGGRASPLDTSTSVEGGVVMLSDQRESLGTWLYTRTLNTPEGERSWEVHAVQPTVEDVYLVLGSTGVHASTSKQVAMVAETLENDPSKQQHIEAIGAVARRGMVALMEGDVEAVGRAMTENHLLLRQLGVSSPELEALVQAAAPTALGVKLTGAGGGGCMVALTRDPERTGQAIELAGGRIFVSTLANAGVKVETV